MFFKDRTIEKRVMAVVRNAIETAQNAYEAAVGEAETVLDQSITRLRENHEIQLAALADEHVAGVLGKLKS